MPLFQRHFEAACALFPKVGERRRINETIRRMINTQVLDLVATTRLNLDHVNPRTIEEVRAARPMVEYGQAMGADALTLKRFLRDQLYQHYKVQRMSAKGRRVVTDLFQAFMADARLLPPQYQVKADRGRARAVADYISGMTDRYAMREHRLLFAVEDI